MHITYHGCSSGCSGALTRRPGVFGSSIVSGSGGFAVPSTLRLLAFAKRAVIASRLGMFLYPLGKLGFFTSGSFASFVSFSVSSFAVSSLSFSSPSSVSGSPLSPTGVTDVLWGGDVERAAGDVERVLGAFTATESAVVPCDDIDACEPVRSSAAARRGREAEEADVVFAFRLMRAASWLSDGMRAPAAGRSGLGTSMGASVVGADIVEVVVESSVTAAHCQ